MYKPRNFSHSWGSMLRTVRVPVAVLLVGGAALLLPPQMKDLLAFVADGGAFGFYVSLVVLGLCAWYWSRAALNARFAIMDGNWKGPAAAAFRERSDAHRFDVDAFVWLPRLILGAAFGVGMLIFAREGRWWGCTTVAAVGAVLMVGAVLRPGRAAGDRRPAPRQDADLSILRRSCIRLHTLLARAPYGTVPATVLLVVGALPLAAGMLEAFALGANLPGLVAIWFPGPAIVILLLALMIGPLAAATFVCDGLTFAFWVFRLRRPPLLTALAVYCFVLVPKWFDVHTVRLLGTKGQQIVSAESDGRKPLNYTLDAWAGACGPQGGDAPLRPVIVAISGGATRAGLWGAAVIDHVLQAQHENGPRLFAISSVSGGSLGAAAAVSLLSREATPCKAQNLSALWPSRQSPQALPPLAGDALGPLLGGWLLDDLPRAFFDPLAAGLRRLSGSRPNGGDSAEAIEQSFERLWAKVPPAEPGWDRPFLSLFYDAKKNNSWRPGMVLWLANGTDATTGNRVITSPVLPPKDSADKNPPWPFRGARDFHTLLGTDIAISTAINNTARFPYLEPFGEMLPADPTKKMAGSLIDGGYFENEGLQTALDLAEWLAAQTVNGRAVKPIIVQATGDGDPTVCRKDVMTCDNASDGAWIPGGSSSLSQLLAPVAGLYHVRGGHSAVLLRQASDQLCKNQAFVHLYLPAKNEEPVPLNWVLSNDMARFIWNDAFHDGQLLNGQELYRLQVVLGGAPQKATPPPERKSCADGDKTADTTK